VISVDGVNKTC